MTDDPAATLNALMRDADARLARLDADEHSLLVDRADATADDEHDPEGSTLSGEWTRVDALRRGVRGERAEIRAALARVADGPSGVCAVCGRPIAEGRLEVRPTAATCVACA